MTGNSMGSTNSVCDFQDYEFGWVFEFGFVCRDEEMGLVVCVRFCTLALGNKIVDGGVIWV